MATVVEAAEFLPLFPEETEDAIIERWCEWANEGLTEDDVDEWVDVRPGSMLRLAWAAPAREAARVYDLMGTEYVAAGIPFWSWGEYLDDHAAGMNVERDAAAPAAGTVALTGVAATVIPAGTTFRTQGMGESSPALSFATIEEVILDGDGAAEVAVEAEDVGPAYNVGTGAISVISTPVVGLQAVTNPDPMTGGVDVESDASLLEKIRQSYSGRGGGSAVDHEVWARAWGNGIRSVTVIPLHDGPNTVLVIIGDEDGDPLPDATVDAYQAFIDPTPGEGAGAAPIGQHVTVATATSVSVAVDAEVEMEFGYSLDGAGGTIDLTPSLLATLATYFDSVKPGDEVVLAKVIGRIVAVDGVHDVGAVTLNGVAANVSLASEPAQVADPDITLTAVS